MLYCVFVSSVGVDDNHNLYNHVAMFVCACFGFDDKRSLGIHGGMYYCMCVCAGVHLWDGTVSFP